MYSLRQASGRPTVYALQFLSGRNQGSEYTIHEMQELVVGRSRDVDLVLIEGMVSRRHARFMLQEGTLTVEDLGSTNGTFVNGRRVVGRQSLAELDRVLVGTAILKVVVPAEPTTEAPPPEAAAPSSKASSEVTLKGANVGGQLDDTSVSELLESLASSGVMAVLELDTRDGLVHITIEEGYVVDCRIPALPDAPALKCIHRALGYDRGTYRVLTHRRPPAKRLFQRIPELVVDGRFKLDELNMLLARLPDRQARVVLAHPLPRLASMDERDLEVMRAAHNNPTVAAILNDSEDTDVEVAKSLLFLLDSGYLKKA